MATQQQVFNAAWNGLKKQGWKKTASWKAATAPAVLRSDTGKIVARCACATVEHTYKSLNVIEGAGLSYYELSSCHDEATSPANMRRRLRDFAKEHGLSVPR